MKSNRSILNQLLTLALGFCLSVISGCNSASRTLPMATQQTDRFPEFMLSMHPAVGRDAIWTHYQGDLTLLSFDGKDSYRVPFHVPGTKIGTSFLTDQIDIDGPVAMNEGRGISVFDLKRKSDLMPFGPGSDYSANSPTPWIKLTNPTTTITCMQFLPDNGGHIPDDTDSKTHIIKAVLPPFDVVPKNPDAFLGLKSVDHAIFDAGPGAHAFLGPKVILIRQPKHDSLKVFDKTTEKWLAIDFDFKPTLHPLLDSLNAYRDSLPAIENLRLAETEPFAVMSHATPTSRSQLIIASWKDKVRFTPVLLNGAPFGHVETLLLAPDGKHFLVGDANETLYLGTVRESDQGHVADLKEVQKFTGSYRLSWMGSSRGFVAGVWDEDETDLFIHWL
jgi:hypothetical protein